jgi:hypothetical protein
LLPVSKKNTTVAEAYWRMNDQSYTQQVAVHLIAKKNLQQLMQVINKSIVQ